MDCGEAGSNGQAGASPSETPARDVQAREAALAIMHIDLTMPHVNVVVGHNEKEEEETRAE